MAEVPELTSGEVMPDLGGLAGDAPRVAVSVSLNFPGLTAAQRNLMRDLTRNTTHALLELGTRPVLLDATAAQLPSTEVEGFDAVVVLGGGDIDPELAGHGQHDGEYFGVDLRADEHTLELIRNTVDAGLPLTAICRGSQLLNVALGGTVIADLDPWQLHHGPPGGELFLPEQVALLRGSRLQQVYGRGDLQVQSGHHQAVDALAEDLAVAAVAHDGTIEATEHRSRPWVIGVQWHPEHSDAPTGDLYLLLGAFLSHVQPRQRHGVVATSPTLSR
ncbi:gamma-glutamyl-gamma-aminobutyrate hydrolase family protein [Glutamicibacter protophormiae]|uniref:gamma-glutamyl-gamma-aminobutyrate hydrolase family protein n=1 Tax=Glutamicibacter protophormiae TaxID=37930 RepID=UPI002A826941|nr:gamma-glutamyl-gamma-aminobutyrate hydrolase family protein [Glutamicibacter protophormiae]WPR64452.1 gamma-glutamyl-gamma-aminobutyrate hydrolase family protein [Glutamicibacter protophormiae]WPR67946.1 gamma-glutamyl-gamma-aminobutyrate hydrolase family protein [Glutamicibacter protophormiae]